jgi:hypothetical protein
MATLLIPHSAAALRTDCSESELDPETDEPLHAPRASIAARTTPRRTGRRQLVCFLDIVRI